MFSLSHHASCTNSFSSTPTHCGLRSIATASPNPYSSRSLVLQGSLVKMILSVEQTYRSSQSNHDDDHFVNAVAGGRDTSFVGGIENLVELCHSNIYQLLGVFWVGARVLLIAISNQR